MGATNTTTYYNLSQFVGTDKPAWLQDYNGDMLKIDTAINAAKVAADSAALDASAAQLDASTALGDITNTITPAITSLQTTVGNQGGAINTINSLIGNGTPTTTDHTIIGAINEINSYITYSSAESVAGLDSDGKTIYKKTYISDSTSISGNTVIDAILTDSVATRVIKIDECFKLSNGWMNGGYIEDSNDSWLFTSVRSDGVRINASNILYGPATAYHITVYYTKD